MIILKWIAQAIPECVKAVEYMREKNITLRRKKISKQK